MKWRQDLILYSGEPDLKMRSTLCTRWACLCVCIYMYEAEHKRNPAHLEIGWWQAAEGESWNFKVIF